MRPQQPQSLAQVPSRKPREIVMEINYIRSPAAHNRKMGWNPRSHPDQNRGQLRFGCKEDNAI